jgi:hypothetical protein
MRSTNGAAMLGPLAVNINLSGVHGPIEQAMGEALKSAFETANRQALADMAG